MSATDRNVLRWTARASGLVVAIAYLAIVPAHILEPHAQPPTRSREWLGIALLSTACLTVFIAWRWPLPGGLLSLAALAAFVLVVHLQQPLVAAVIATPGMLYLLDWLVGHLQEQPRTSQ